MLTGMSLTDKAFWADLYERVLRNEVQTLGPLFAVMSATGILLDWRDASLSALYVLLWTFVKNAAGVQASAGAPQWKVLLDRIGSAVAASLIATVPERFWGYDHWDRVAWSALGAAAVALLMLHGSPPSMEGTGSESGDVDGLAGRPRRHG